MPRGNGTGPEGKGPATGRGLGNCKSTTKNAPTNRPLNRRNNTTVGGRGLGQGGRGGRGLGRK